MFLNALFITHSCSTPSCGSYSMSIISSNETCVKGRDKEACLTHSCFTRQVAFYFAFLGAYARALVQWRECYGWREILMKGECFGWRENECFGRREKVSDGERWFRMEREGFGWRQNVSDGERVLRAGPRYREGMSSIHNVLV